MKIPPKSEDLKRLEFFLDREPSEVIRLKIMFDDLIRRDVGPLYEWKQAQAKAAKV